MKRTRGLLVLLMVFTLVSGAMAADFPNEPIRLVLPMAPGGSTDVTARAFAEVAKNYCDQPFVVVNMPGASGNTGIEEVVRSKPDGHTLLFFHTMALSTFHTGVQKKSTFETLDPIASLAEAPNTIQVHATSPWQTLEDLAADAKNRPGKITWAIGGIGGTTHFTTAGVTDGLGIEIRLVVYQGGAERRAALAGKQVDVVTGTIGEGWDFFQEGTVRYLAVSGDQRVKVLPDVPALGELGINAIGLTYYLWAPKGTPPEVMATLQDIIEKACADPKFIELNENYFQTVAFRKGEELETQMREQDAIIAELAEKLGLKE